MAWGARNVISTEVTNVHRIGETIGDAWPLVAVDRVHRGGKWARDRQTFNKNKKHLTDHDAAIRHDGSLDRLSACVNATAASPLGDVAGGQEADSARRCADDAPRLRRLSLPQSQRAPAAAARAGRRGAGSRLRCGRIGRIGERANDDP